MLFAPVVVEDRASVCACIALAAPWQALVESALVENWFSVLDPPPNTVRESALTEVQPGGNAEEGLLTVVTS